MDLPRSSSGSNRPAIVLVGLILFWFAVVATFWGTVIYVAHHFITKWW